MREKNHYDIAKDNVRKIIREKFYYDTESFIKNRLKR